MGVWDGYSDFEWSERNDIDILSFAVSKWGNGWDFEISTIMSDFRHHEREAVPHTMALSQASHHGEYLCLCLNGEHHRPYHDRDKETEKKLPIQIELQRIETGECFKFEKPDYELQVNNPQLKAAGRRDGYMLSVRISRNHLSQLMAGDWSNRFHLKIRNQWADDSQSFQLTVRVPPLVKIGFSNDILITGGQSAFSPPVQGTAGVCIHTNNGDGYKLRVSGSTHYEWWNGFRLCLNGHCGSGAVKYSLGVRFRSDGACFNFDRIDAQSHLFYEKKAWDGRCVGGSACADLVVSIAEMDLKNIQSGNYSDTIKISIEPD